MPLTPGMSTRRRRHESSSTSALIRRIKGFLDFKQRLHMKHEDISQQFYHGTKTNLKQGDLIAPGYNSNYGKGKKASYVYLTATLDAAIWGAELAQGEGPGRIYIVE